MNTSKKILFMGTTDFASAVLQTLLKMSDFEVIGVVCQPDRPVGRKQEIIFSPVKTLALLNNLLIFQPYKINDEYLNLQQLNIDLIVTCAYGQFLPEKILNLAKVLAINVHASLLPELRGGAPIHWAIIRDYQQTGITLMKMSKKMDAGAIFIQQTVSIDVDETYLTLKSKLMVLAENLINSSLLNIVTGALLPTEQDETQVSFGYNILRDDELINWSKSARLVSCQIRGLYDSPIAYTHINQFIFKIHKITVTETITNQMPGTITKINKQGIFVATNDYEIIINDIQPEGRKVLSAANFFGSSQQRLAVVMRFNNK